MANANKVRIKNPNSDQTTLVPNASVEHWMKKGWVEVGEEKSEDLSSMTKAELNELAEARGIDPGSNPTKADLVSALSS